MLVFFFLFELCVCAIPMTKHVTKILAYIELICELLLMLQKTMCAELKRLPICNSPQFLHQIHIVFSHPVRIVGSHRRRNDPLEMRIRIKSHCHFFRQSCMLLHLRFFFFRIFIVVYLVFAITAFDMLAYFYFLYIHQSQLL